MHVSWAIKTLGCLIPTRQSHYMFVRHTDRLAQARLMPWVRRTNDVYDNALVQTLNGACTRLN